MNFFRHRDIRFWLACVIVAAGAALAVYLLLIPPVLGVADNGDFSRVMRITGFSYLDPSEPYAEKYFAYSHQQFGYGGFWGAGYVSTQVLLFAVTGLIARIFNGQFFDVRWLGVVYTLLYLATVYLWVRHTPSVNGRRWLTGIVAAFMGALLLFVFGDVGYLAYFQSFFGEPYAMIGMLLALAATLALASREEPSGRMLAVFIIAAVAVATSKIQNAPIGFAFALLAWRMFSLRPDRRWHRQVLSGIGILLFTSVLMIVAAPSGLKHINLYQSIFFGVLKDTPDLSRDMKELGIPDKYAVNAGTNYFQKDAPIPQTDPVLHREVLQKLGHKDIAMYYLRHPSRFVEKLERVSANAVFIRPYYLGNYDQSAGNVRGAVSHSFSSYSDWKVKRMPHTLGWFAGFYVLYFAVLGFLWSRSSSVRFRLGLEAMAAVGLAGIFSAVVPILGDGEADLGKHLFMFNVCFDMMVVSAAAGIVYGFLRMFARSRAS
jgi:hypothetical protein